MTTTAEPGTSLAPYEAPAAPALRVPALPDLPDVDSWIRAMASIAKLADKICDTDFVPAAMRGKPDAVTAAILTGRELGLPPMLALRTINMIKGTPSLSAEYMRSKVLSLGHEFRIDEWDEQHCVIYARRKGAPGGREFSYAIGEARKAGLIRKNRDGSPGKYETDPMAMMLARATTRACKAMFGDVINGLATTELLGDADVMAEITGTALELPAAPKPEVADLRQRAAAHTVTATVVTPEPSPAAPDAPPSSGPAAVPPAEVAAAGEAPSRPPQRASSGQVGMVRKAFERITRIKADDETEAQRTERLRLTSRLARVPYPGIASTSELTAGQARDVREVLARCVTVADVEALLDGGALADDPREDGEPGE